MSNPAATISETLRNRPELARVVRVGVLFATFVLFVHFLRRAADLPLQSYFEPHLSLELIQRLGVWPTALLVAAVWLSARYGFLLDEWSELELGQQLRWFVLLLVLLLAWPFTTYEYNYYFDQGYYVDRALIAILVPLIWYRPAFIYPFLLLGLAMFGQLGEPDLGSGAQFPHKYQLLLVLSLFAATFLLHAVAGLRRMDGFFLITCCIVASAYWVPGLEKAKMNWITHGHVYRMLPAAYAHGWLSNLSPSTIVSAARALAWFDWPVRLFVLAAELGCLFFVWKRSFSLALLLAVTVFHAATFALYGYLFWTWIGLNAALFVLLFRDRVPGKIDIYRPGLAVLSVGLIATSGWWARPASLAWFDTRLSYTYRLSATGVSGRHYALPPGFFGPYGDVFTMGAFSYLVNEHRMLVGPYAVTVDRARADGLMAVRTSEEVFALETTLGTERYDAERERRFYEFIARFVDNWNDAYPAAHPDLHMLRPPRVFWSFPRGQAFSGQERLRDVTVREVTMLFDDQRLLEIRELELRRIALGVNDGLRQPDQPERDAR